MLEVSRPDHAVYLGLDVGKAEHHATGLDPAGERVHDKALPQDARRCARCTTSSPREACCWSWSTSRPRSALCRWRWRARAGIDVAYLPGLAMRRIADLHPGNAKTDARDAYIIAEAARSMPHALRRVDLGDEALADLQVIVGYDDDLAKEITRVTNRICGLLTQIHPALERALGSDLHHRAVLELLARFGGPTGLRKAQRRQLIAATKPRAPREHAAIVDAVIEALPQVRGRVVQVVGGRDDRPQGGLDQ